MELPTEFNKIVQFLIDTDTNSVIDNLAQNILEVANYDKNPLISDNRFQLMGIMLLAVDDAKTQEHLSSANPLYKAVFNRAKELLQS